MPKSIRMRCNNCGRVFEAAVLDEEEKREARRRSQPLFAIQCPSCRKTDIRPD